MRISTTIFSVIMIAFSFAACATHRKTVAQAEALTEVRTERVEVHDTICKTDTIIEREQVVVRPADSLTMAQYGVQIQAGQTAWIVERDRLRREIDRLTEKSTENVATRDTVTLYYETIREVEVERKPSVWENFSQKKGNVFMMTLALLALLWIVRRKE